MKTAKAVTNQKTFSIPCAFGDVGSIKVKPPLSASALGAATAVTSRAPLRARSRRTGCHSMNVSEGSSRRTRVRLPPDVTRPFEVYLNGVPQQEGEDFRVEGRTLVFDRELKTEGKLSAWRWLSMWVGVAGTYRQNDSVDVVYQRNGRRAVATKLPLEPLA